MVNKFFNKFPFTGKNIWNFNLSFKWVQQHWPLGNSPEFPMDRPSLVCFLSFRFLLTRNKTEPRNQWNRAFSLLFGEKKTTKKNTSVLWLRSYRRNFIPFTLSVWILRFPAPLGSFSYINIRRKKEWRSMRRGRDGFTPEVEREERREEGDTHYLPPEQVICRMSNGVVSGPSSWRLLHGCQHIPPPPNLILFFF